MIDVEALARRATTRRWCPEIDTRDSITARRNALAGLWAGRLMRLADDALSIYAAEVHGCGSIAGSDREVVDKIWYDLNRAGVATPRETIAEKLEALHREAAVQLATVGA
ncbi:hypothetical protein A33M_2559 [Rhodovulum sp. PH10]|uniref:ATPase inhibitor subunit zeta n=1 Tax=Rhodovulum sp. PH10 TaxID=1187851 RepID=UPI00027C1E2B|nr:ATPase inhibitor subunit zeta [Rhodovulum sp. PH10]EJW12021.1 hypothetical protein A33M_2559 [Rhodovulum sp. PH10]